MNLCRVQLPECFDIRTSDFFIPNGTYSDFVLLVWGITSLTLMYFGMWKLVFFSLPALVFTLKATDVVGRKFGYNILRSTQEMSFYPVRLMKIQKTQNCLKNQLKTFSARTPKNNDNDKWFQNWLGIGRKQNIEGICNFGLWRSHVLSFSHWLSCQIFRYFLNY